MNELFQVIEFSENSNYHNAVVNMTKLLNDGYEVIEQYDVRYGTLIVLRKFVEWKDYLYLIN